MRSGIVVLDYFTEIELPNSGFLDRNGKDAKGEEDSDDEPVYNARRLKREVRSGAECPYLDTISRQVLCYRHLTLTMRCFLCGLPEKLCYSGVNPALSSDN